MDFKENADVLNTRGEKMGTIDRVVIDPENRKVTHLVAKKGLLFTREKVRTVPLAEGAGVICRDGEKAGRIERIFSEPEEHRATHLVISSGLISKDKKLVPSIWIDRIEEDAVHLKVGCEVIEGLPPFPRDIPGPTFATAAGEALNEL